MGFLFNFSTSNNPPSQTWTKLRFKRKKQIVKEREGTLFLQWLIFPKSFWMQHTPFKISSLQLFLLFFFPIMFAYKKAKHDSYYMDI